MKNRWKGFQIALLASALLALGTVIVVLLQILLSPVLHGGPARVVHTSAGPYQLAVTFYSDQANPGYAFPFALSVQHEPAARITYALSAIPGHGIDAPVAVADISQHQNGPDGVPGSVNIVQQGPWTLHIIVSGPQGTGQVSLPLSAAHPPVMPMWMAWVIGLLPLYSLVIFMVIMASKRKAPQFAPLAQDEIPEKESSEFVSEDQVHSTR